MLLLVFVLKKLVVCCIRTIHDLLLVFYNHHTKILGSAILWQEEAETYSNVYEKRD